MRFSQYLIENRSKSMAPDKAIEWIKNNAKDALDMAKQGSVIYRGLKQRADALIVDPSKTQRKSAYVGKNYYTLLMSNLPSWKQYPKRSESIVCSTNKSYASGYGLTGDIYIVFPKDGSKIGIAPEEDIFYSFPILGKLTKTSTMREWTEKFTWVDVAHTGHRDSDKSWVSMLKLFKAIDKNKKDDSDQEAITKTAVWDHKWLYTEKGSTIKILDNKFHPGRNGFKLQTIGVSKLPLKREVWTDGESVLLSLEEFTKLMVSEGADTIDRDDISTVSNYNISELDIIIEDMKNDYYEVDRNTDDSTVEVSYSPVVNGNEWIVVGDTAPVIKSLLKGKTKINLEVNTYNDLKYTNQKLFQYKSHFKYKGVEVIYYNKTNGRYEAEELIDGDIESSW